MHSLTSGLLAKTQASALRPIAFVEVDTLAGNVYFWTGLGEITWNGQTWTGSGALLSIAPITEQNKVEATGVELQLSGVPTDYVSLALQSLNRYMPGKIWIGATDDAFNVIADPYQILNGRVDSAKIDDDGTSSTITVSLENRLITIINSAERRYTDEDQRTEHPADAGFQFADFLQDASIFWGVKDSSTFIGSTFL